MDDLKDVKKQFPGQSCQFSGILSFHPPWMAMQEIEEIEDNVSYGKILFSE